MAVPSHRIIKPILAIQHKHLFHILKRTLHKQCDHQDPLPFVLFYGIANKLSTVYACACVCGLVLLSLVFSILCIQCPFSVLTLQTHTTSLLVRLSVWKWVNKLSLILNEKQCSWYDLPVFISRMQLKLHWFVVAVEKVAGRWWHQRDQHFFKFYENCNGNTMVFFILCHRSENLIVSIEWNSFFWLFYKIKRLISNLNSLEKLHILCWTSPSIFISIDIKMNPSRFAK